MTSVIVEQNPVFVENMRYLWLHDPELARKLDAISDESRVELESTRSGDLTAVLTDSEGRKVYLHSRYEPIVEAQRLISGLEGDEPYCYIVGGFRISLSFA